MTNAFVHQLFQRNAARWPGRIAIDTGAGRITYAELEARASGIAARLAAAGVKAGTPLGLLGDECAGVVAAMLGVLAMGAAFVPLDPGLPEKRLLAMIEAAGLDTFLVASSMEAAAADLAARRGARLIPLDLGRGEAAGQASSPWTAAPPDALAYIYFTSGSTGAPKPIAGRLKAIDHFVRWEIETFGLDESCRASQLTTPQFDAYLRDVFTPLCAGGTVCAPGDRQEVLDPARLVAWLDAARVSLVHCVPSLLRTMLGEQLTHERFGALRHVLTSGEPLLPSDVRRWTSVFGERIQLVNLYGPTETTMTKLFYPVSAADAERRSIPIGKPMAGAQAVLLDEAGAPCGPGRIGEIYIRTPYRSLGYYRQPELTRSAFVANPFSDDADDLLYRTGDLGRMLADGNFEFVGRRDQQVKIRGVRVETAEIEDLLRTHPAVTDAAVVGRDDAGGTKFLCAYLVTLEPVSPGELRDFLAPSLPETMIPSVFMPLTSLPRTISGKVDRRGLPDPLQAAATQAYVAPSTPAEEALAELFAKLLGRARVSVEDDFFQLGGHSLLGTQLLSRVRQSFGVEVPLRVLFRSPTVSALALAVTQLRAEQDDREDVARLLREVAELSESEVENALTRERPEEARGSAG